MKTKTLLVLKSAVFLVGITTLGCTSGEQEKPFSQGLFSVEGTYRLVSGEFFDDETTILPQDLMGLMTFTKTHRSSNFMAIDDKGRVSSVSSIATYKLTPTEYTETCISYVAHDGIRNQITGYDFTHEIGTSPVKTENECLKFTFPLHDGPSAVFEGDKVIMEGPDFVFNWERVQ
jgi:hypothetical protein